MQLKLLYTCFVPTLFPCVMLTLLLLPRVLGAGGFILVVG